MSLQGQQQSLGALLELKVRLAFKQDRLLKEQRLVNAELTTIEELLASKRYKETIAVQSHLAVEAVARIKALSERSTEVELAVFPIGQQTLNAEFAQADQRYSARLRLAEKLLDSDETAQGCLQATQALEARRQFIAALQHHERAEAILKWSGQSPESIKQWKEEDWKRIYSQAEDDTERDEIIAAGDALKSNDQEELEAAKPQYLALLGEVTLLVDQVRHLQSLLADSELERRQIERNAKTESQMLRKMYALNLLSGQPELSAYRSASESLLAARNMHSKRLDAARQKCLTEQIAQIEQLLDKTKCQKALGENTEEQVRTRLKLLVAERNVDALAQIRRELAELIALAEQAKSGPAQALVFEDRQRSAITVITGAVASAIGPQSTLQARAEGGKATELSRELEESHQPRTRI
jgi:septum formation topological specificity factor MinE